MARFGNARQEDRPTAGKKASERAKHRASLPFEKISGWDVTTDFDDLSLDVWAKQTQNRPSNSRRNEKIPSKYLCTTETRCSGLQSPAEFSTVTLADELTENTQLLINHDAGHRDDFTIQKRAIEKELVAQRGTNHHSGKTQTTKSSTTKNDSSHSRLTHNGSTRHEQLDVFGSSKSINSATFSKLLSISSSRNHESDHVSREHNGHLADNVNNEQAAIKSTSPSVSKIQNGKTSTQEVEAPRSQVESRVLLPSVRFTYTKTKDQRPESGVSLSSYTTEQTEGSGSSFSTLRTIESSEDSKSSSTGSAAVTATRSSSGESGSSQRSTGPELPPVNHSPSPTLMAFPSDGIAKFFTSWARSFAESVSNEEDQDLPTDIFARYSRNKRASLKARTHNSAREIPSIQHLKDSRTSRSAPSLTTAEDNGETSSKECDSPLAEIRRDPKFADGAVSPCNYPIRDVLPDGIAVQRGLPGRKLKAPDVSSPTKISLQQGWREDDLSGWSTPPMYQGDVIIVKDGVDLEKLKDQNTNGPPAFRPQHLKTPLQRARDIVQRRLGNPQAEISNSPTGSPPRRWKSSYSNMYEPTKQRSGELRAQSEQSPRAHIKHALGQHDVSDPGQRVNSKPSRDGVHQKTENPPPLRDRHELASRDPWNYVMQYMGRVPAVKTSSNILRQ